MSFRFGFLTRRPLATRHRTCDQLGLCQFQIGGQRCKGCHLYAKTGLQLTARPGIGSRLRAWWRRWRHPIYAGLIGGLLVAMVGWILLKTVGVL